MNQYELCQVVQYVFFQMFQCVACTDGSRLFSELLFKILFKFVANGSTSGASIDSSICNLPDVSVRICPDDSVYICAADCRSFFRRYNIDCCS